MSILISGTVALDSIHTPSEVHHELLGGSASYAALAASLESPVFAWSIVGKDFPAEHSTLLTENGIDISNIEFADGRTFRWTDAINDSIGPKRAYDVP